MNMKNKAVFLSSVPLSIDVIQCPKKRSIIMFINQDEKTKDQTKVNFLSLAVQLEV
jgi:hypothetical protein